LTLGMASKIGMFFFIVFELLNLILIFKKFKFIRKVYKNKKSIKSAYKPIKHLVL